MIQPINPDFVQDDIQRINSLLTKGNDENLKALHIELDGTYQTCIRGWGQSMYGFSEKYGFNYELIDNDSIHHNLNIMKGKLRGYILQLFPKAEQQTYVSVIP